MNLLANPLFGQYTLVNRLLDKCRRKLTSLPTVDFEQRCQCMPELMSRIIGAELVVALMHGTPIGEFAVTDIVEQRMQVTFSKELPPYIFKQLPSAGCLVCRVLLGKLGKRACVKIPFQLRGPVVGDHSPV